MNKDTGTISSNKWIVSERGKKNTVDFNRPYAWLVEKERSRSGKVEDTAIIFLTNKECPFKCLMCDLWKNTTDQPVPTGAIPEQIKWALNQMPSAKHIKLYNSGSFFDEKAIPVGDYEEIAVLLQGFETVIVEAHPKLISEKCLSFRDMLKPRLEVALGLETIHPEVLPKLNKGMTLEDFEKAVGFLSQNNISSRAFILLRPPFLSEDEGILWAEKSIDFAFETGIECCTVIPVRAGNGAMERLEEMGHFQIPKITSLEKVLEYGIQLQKGRVFADLWDVSLFSNCDLCLEARTNRMKAMNLNQTIGEMISCDCE
ncbi:radical SAM protein [Maribacter luteus]|uniref:radical SAM protein n=1 Tax=Maribacter luteus TaxID=2594478 RepID=UPI002492E2D5|nr:hypothetical protein [Maribacter luteus]